MKRQVDLPTLVAELKSQAMQKLDMVIPASHLSMVNGQIVVNNPSANPELSKILFETGISETGDGLQKLKLDRLDTVNSHLIDKLGIPTKYFDKCDSPEHLALLDQNVSYWLKEAKKNFLLRMFVDKEQSKGVVRAFLSDSFKAIDNYDILLATLQAINEVKRDSGIDIKIDDKGCDISDKRVYLRFIAPQIEIDAPKLISKYRPNGSRPGGVGNGIVSGFSISNSEVGAGQFSIAARLKILVCENGMTSTDEKFNQRHLGAKMDEFQTTVWTEETKQKNMELIICQIKDSIKEYITPECLGRQIAAIEAKAGYEVKHPADCIKQITQSLNMSEEKADDILNTFIKSGDTSAFGITQAFTLYAHTNGSADEQFDIERQAMAVLESVEAFDKPITKKLTVKQAAQLN
jgi:hypothetical protein